MAYTVSASAGTPSRSTITLLSTSHDISSYHWIWCQWGLTTDYGNETDKHKVSSVNTRGDTIFSQPSNTTYHFRSCIQPDVGGSPSGEIHYSDDATTATLVDDGMYLRVTGGGISDPDPDSEGYPFSTPAADPPIKPIANAYQYIDEAVIADDLFYTRWWRAYESNHYYRQFFTVQDSESIPDEIKFNVLMVRSNRHTLKIGLYKAGLGYWESEEYTSGVLGQGHERWESYTLETNPLTELPWAEGDLSGLQISIYIKMHLSSGTIGCVYAELEGAIPSLGLAGYLWVEEMLLHWITADEEEKQAAGTLVPPAEGGITPGYIWVEEEYLHYIGAGGYERRIWGIPDGASGITPGYIWIEGELLRYIDADGVERYIEGTSP